MRRGLDEIAKQRFAERGIDVAVVIPAFTGLYPLVNGWGNWEWLFTRHRFLVRVGDSVQVWVALTGGVPGVLLGESQPGEVVSLSNWGRYNRMLVGKRRFWVHRRYRDQVGVLSADSAARS